MTLHVQIFLIKMNEIIIGGVEKFGAFQIFAK